MPIMRLEINDIDGHYKSSAASALFARAQEEMYRRRGAHALFHDNYPACNVSFTAMPGVSLAFISWRR